VSKSLRGTAARKAICRGKLQTIYNGISFPVRSHSTFRETQGIPESAIVVGNVGNLYPVKGQRYLVEAFARFLTIAPHAFLVLVGRGQEQERLRQLAADLKIAPERIVFTGFQKDVANILSALDIYVQPSLSEGFPVAVLEALSLDLPVVATCVGGVPEIITGEDIGILVPPGSPEAIFNALEKITKAQEVFACRAKTAGAFIRQQFSVSQMTNEYMALYRQLLGSGTTPHLNVA